MTLILVRHAMPLTDPDVPSGEWRLAREGKVAARALRPLLPVRSYLVASTEAKAIETLAELTDPADVTVDEASLPFPSSHRDRPCRATHGAASVSRPCPHRVRAVGTPRRPAAFAQEKIS